MHRRAVAAIAPIMGITIRAETTRFDDAWCKV